MRRPPSLNEIGKYPVTGGVALLAAAVTLAWWSHWDISRLVMSGPRLWREPWRLLTSALPHGSFFHIAFNLYWTWVFGTLMERQFGRVRYAGLLVLLAAGSAAAQFAVSAGGVGLSGVGYGLFGMLWVVSLFDRRFSDAIDQPTIVTFVVWFFLCIVLTELDVLRIANVAHGAGAVIGALTGWIYVRRGKRQVLPLGLLVGVLAVIGWGMSVGRTTVNFSQWAGEEYAIEADRLLDAGKTGEAVAGYRKALSFRNTDPRWEYNLGVAYWRRHELDEALRCFRIASQRAPSKAMYRETLQELEDEVAESRRATTESQQATGASTRKN